MSDCTTPNKSGAGGGSRTSLVDCDMEDINGLLYLEMLKRFRDDESSIKRQVEEKMRQYEMLREEYVRLYIKYVRVVQLVATRTVLDEDTGLKDSSIATALENVDGIMSITGTGEIKDFVQSDVVELCRKNLAEVEEHPKLAQMRQEHDEVRSLVRSMQASGQDMESVIELATIQGLEYFVDQLQIDD